jgi:hypothetical protein
MTPWLGKKEADYVAVNLTLESIKQFTCQINNNYI